MGLKEYKQKRNFKKTQEPTGNVKRAKTKKKIFVVHFHRASHNHHDLRLELKGVLKSWAVPKGPPKGNEKKLAVQTEDHPLAYATFQGTIPKGQYGAGKVEIWDSGFYELFDVTNQKYVINIHGKKLKGAYVLIKLKKDDQDKNWIFFKKKE